MHSKSFKRFSPTDVWALSHMLRFSHKQTHTHSAVMHHHTNRKYRHSVLCVFFCWSLLLLLPLPSRWCYVCYPFNIIFATIRYTVYFIPCQVENRFSFSNVYLNPWTHCMQTFLRFNFTLVLWKYFPHKQLTWNIENNIYLYIREYILLLFTLLLQSMCLQKREMKNREHSFENWFSM